MAEYVADLTLYAKLLSRNSRGVLPLASATAMSIATASRAWAPLPPGNVKLNSLAYSAWPATTTGDVTLSWSHRNRVTRGQGVTLTHQDSATSDTIEGTLTIKAYVGGTLKRTWSVVTGTSQVYTIADRTTDDADLSKVVYFTITPVNGSYTGTVRTTPTFVMGS